jgi:hypothetical protein
MTYRSRPFTASVGPMEANQTLRVEQEKLNGSDNKIVSPRRTTVSEPELQSRGLDAEKLTNQLNK